MEHLRGRELFVQDLFCGADPAYRLPVRIVNEYAWHNLFVRQLFMRPTAEELRHHRPEFTVIAAPEFKADPKRDGVNSEVFILLNFTRRTVLIGGTSYAGEMKKSIFSIMNFLLPPRNVFPMHCSANVGHNGVSALFFGLSGTGKTTLSADPSRDLIGDDEHGWSADGSFQLRGWMLRQVHQALEEERAADLERAALRLRSGKRDARSAHAHSGLQRRQQDRKHARRLSGGLHRKCGDSRHWRASEERGLPDRGCFRRAAADFKAYARAGDVSLFLGLHREGRGDRSRSEGTYSNVLNLLRIAVPSAALRRLTPRCWAAACASTMRSAGW